MHWLSLVAIVVFSCSLKAENSPFSKVKDILAERCLSCHNAESKLINGGNLSIETLEDIIKGGNRGRALTPGDSSKSLLYTTLVLAEDKALAMPPANRFSRVPEEELNIIKTWINNGAKWPEGEKISYKKGTPSGDTIDPLEMALVEKIHAKILATEKKAANSEPYTAKIDGVRATLKMMPIPAGSFLWKGTAPGDSLTANIDAFWIAEKELPWDLYSPFMEPEISRNKDGYPQNNNLVPEGEVILAQPSKPYHAMSFGMGVRRHPAIAMTHHAANKYCQWLSWQTGQFYRLPTEAEWEYAARAGESSDAPKEVESFGWYNENHNTRQKTLLD